MITINELYLKEAYDIRLRYLSVVNTIKNEENNFLDLKRQQIEIINNYKDDIKSKIKDVQQENIQTEVESFLENLNDISKESDIRMDEYFKQLQELIDKSSELAEKIKSKYPGIQEEDYQSQIMDYLLKRGIN